MTAPGGNGYDIRDACGHITLAIEVISPGRDGAIGFKGYGVTRAPATSGNSDDAREVHGHIALAITIVSPCRKFSGFRSRPGVCCDTQKPS